MSDLNEPDHFNDDPEQGVIQVPWQQLSSDALRGIAEEFVNREGTDYGEYEVSFDDKVDQVIHQVQSGDVVILFDPVMETCQLVLKRELSNFNHQ